MIYEKNNGISHQQKWCFLSQTNTCSRSSLWQPMNNSDVGASQPHCPDREKKKQNLNHGLWWTTMLEMPENKSEILIRPNQKKSLFPVARPGHFSPKLRTLFLNHQCTHMCIRIFAWQLWVPARGESNFKVKRILGRQSCRVLPRHIEFAACSTGEHGPSLRGVLPLLEVDRHQKH